MCVDAFVSMCVSTRVCMRVSVIMFACICVACVKCVRVFVCVFVCQGCV